MSALEAVETYYELFGFRGVMLAAKSRLLRRRTEIVIRIPGIKHPVRLRLRTTDVSVFRQVFVIHEYDWEFSKSPLLIVDAGANIGLTSIFYANRYPDATIVAIEPESSNFQMLKKNIAPYSNVTAVQAALWMGNGEVRLVDHGLGHDAFQTTEKPAADCGRVGLPGVSAVTVDKLMTDLNINYIDILKVDIEGSEKEVFEKAASWIDRVGVIVVELHDRLKVGCSRSVYRAVKDFEFEWHKGETVFFLKKDYVSSENLALTAAMDAPRRPQAGME